MLVGFFGLLFVSALQGEGDFYGDLKEPRWSFVDADHDRKVRFDNPVLEMDKKVDLFRRLMSQKKVYNLKIDTAVVVVGTKSEVPMYLSHMGEENIVMTVKDFKRFLEKEKFERTTTSMSLPSHRPSPPLENKIANRKGFCPSCFFARLQCFTPILVILLPSFLLLLPVLPFLTKTILFFFLFLRQTGFCSLAFPAFFSSLLAF